MDNFFIHMFKRREATVVKRESTDTSTSSSSTAANYAENIVYAGSQDAALKIATFYRCLELRANTMAQLTCMYQRKDRDGDNFMEENYGMYGRLNYLLQVRPNPLMSSFEMWRQREIETVLRGNAFIYIERDPITGWPTSLWLASFGGYDSIKNIYTLTYNALGGPRTVQAPGKDVLHFANTFRRQGGFLGIPTLAYAADMLSLTATLDKGALETSAKGGRMKLLIGEEKANSGSALLSGGLYSKPEMDKYAAELQNRLYSADVVALRGLDKVQNVSMTATDMQLFEQRQFSIAEICRVMSVPRTLAMDGSNSSYKTPEADRLDFLLNFVQPNRRYIEDEMNSKLLGPDDWGKRRIHLCELPLMMFDKKSQAQIDKMNLETGAMTVNEIRKQYDMPAVPNGDIVYVSTNLAELGSDKLKSSPSPVVPDPSASDKQEGGEE